MGASVRWDGVERRVGDTERRKAQLQPHAEYPKFVDGQVFQTADDHQRYRDGLKSASKPDTAESDADTKSEPAKKTTRHK